MQQKYARSKLDDLMIQLKMLPANQIEHGQRILDKFTNSRLTDYLTIQDVRQINKLLRKKRSVGINLGLLRTKKLGDLYPNLKEFLLQQQYHSQGFKKIKQTQRNLEIQKRKKRQTQERIAEQKRLNLQRQIAQAKILDNVLKVPSLPDNITYKSLLSMTYFENYKGFNSGGNAPGKNILNIGEQHFGVDDGFKRFEDFMDTLVAKNQYLGLCLDFVFESGLKNINDSALFQKQGLSNIPTVFRQDKSSTLVTLRNFFAGKTIVKGFRAHHTDTRLGFEGWFPSLINISNDFNFDDYDNRIILKYIYDFYQPYDNKTQIEMDIFNKLLKLDTDNLDGLKETNETLNYLKQKQEGTKHDDKIKYYENRLEFIKFSIHYYKMFIVSIKNFVQKAVGQKLKQKGNILDENDMTVVNREMYYKYLEEKGSDRNAVENKIFNNKRFDLKFQKQINNLDTRYFKSDPKKTILLYYLDYIGMSDQAYFYDIHTICRVFRKFDEKKERYSSCDQNDTSMRNVIIYSGNYHTQNINKFLQLLPGMEVDNITNRLYMETEKMELPVLSFGDVGVSIEKVIQNGLDDYDDEKISFNEIKIPLKYDYFDYNKKIIQNLKNDYNVKQYTQLPKAIQKEEEERKMKQKEKRQLQQKAKREREEKAKIQREERMRKQRQKRDREYRAKIQEQKQRDKIYTMNLQQFGTEFNEFNGPGTFTGTLINSKPNKGKIKFANGTHFKGKYLSKVDLLIGDMTFMNGTKFNGNVKKDDKNKYDGKLIINDENYKEGVFDSDFNIAQSNITDFKIDNNKYSYLHEYKILRAPEQLEDKVSEQKLNQLGKQLFQKQNVNYDVLKQFSDKMNRQYLGMNE